MTCLQLLRAQRDFATENTENTEGTERATQGSPLTIVIVVATLLETDWDSTIG